MKKLLLVSLCLIGLSACNPDTISYRLLEKGKTLYVITNNREQHYKQEENRCYVYNAMMNDYVNGDIYYSFSNEQKNIAIKIKGEVDYTFYHYTIDSWCIL